MWMDGSTDGRWLESHPISSPGVFGSGELNCFDLLTPSQWSVCVKGQNICLHGAYVTYAPAKFDIATSHC